jgi:hypothetical protein
MVLAGKESKDNLVEVMHMLQATSNPQVEYIMSTISKICAEKGINLPPM